MNTTDKAQNYKTKHGLGDGAITSCTETGVKKWSSYKHGRKIVHQLEYRHTDGKLFTTASYSFELCLQRQREWLSNKGV